LSDPLLLLVDDDVGSIQLLRRILAAYKNVRFATGGEAALRIARSSAPDLILLDAEMPGMDGFAVIKALKEDPALCDVPVVFVTAHHDMEFETRALGLGAADFIGKPLSAPSVQLRVRNQLLIKRQADTLRKLAYNDALTGLANRRMFDDALDQEWRRAQRFSHQLSLLLVDVDFFKLYNDAYGHEAGDQCLQRVAAALRASARRPGDLTARYGGEEFALLLPHTDAAGARHVADKLLAGVAQLAIPHEATLVQGALVTVSVGVTCFDQASGGWPQSSLELRGTFPPAQTYNPKQLVAAADRALYAAKRGGRARAEYQHNDIQSAPVPVSITAETQK
jgi:diguanylate cyclase (GGDEF)-like protein